MVIRIQLSWGVLVFCIQNECKSLNKVISYVSTLTLGMYLLGDKLISIIPQYFTDWKINEIVKVLTIDVIIFIVGAVITSILKKIPLIRKVL